MRQNWFVRGNFLLGDHTKKIHSYTHAYTVPVSDRDRKRIYTFVAVRHLECDAVFDIQALREKPSSCCAVANVASSGIHGIERRAPTQLLPDGLERNAAPSSVSAR